VIGIFNNALGFSRIDKVTIITTETNGGVVTGRAVGLKNTFGHRRIEILQNFTVWAEWNDATARHRKNQVKQKQSLECQHGLAGR